MIVYSRDKKLLIVPSGIGNLDQEYRQGFEDGKAYQESADQTKLTQITIDRNGTYEADYGYSSVVVDVPQTGSGCNLMSKTYVVETTSPEFVTLTPNVGYDGFYEVVLDCQNVNSAYTDGYIYGRQFQKSQLSQTAITQNGTFTREDGWDRVVVNVPQSGSGCNLRSKDLIIPRDWEPDVFYVLHPTGIDDGFYEVNINVENFADYNYQNGYTNGYNSGYTAGQMSSGSPWYGFQFIVDTTINTTFTGNPMDIYLKVSSTGDGNDPINYGFVNMLNAGTFTAYTFNNVQKAGFNLWFSVNNLVYFERPYAFDVYIPKSEITNWPNIISIDTDTYLNIQDVPGLNTGIYLNAVNVSFSDEIPFAGGPECKKLHFDFYRNLNNQ